MNNQRGITVECTACGWQGDESLTDARYCPECGGECADLQEIYCGDGATTAPTTDPLSNPQRWRL
jgi:rubredoxin